MAALPPHERERRNAAAIPVVAFPGFLLWLAKQRDRTDHAGALARYVEAIEQARGGHFAGLVPLLCHVHAAGGGPAITLLDLALAEWRAGCVARPER